MGMHFVHVCYGYAFCNKFIILNHCFLTIFSLLNVHQVTLQIPPFTVIMNSIFCLKEWAWMTILNYVIFPAKIQISKFKNVPYMYMFSGSQLIDTKILSCSTEFEVCDSFASLTRQQTSYSCSVGWYFLYQSIEIQITYTSLTPNHIYDFYWTIEHESVVVVW